MKSRIIMTCMSAMTLFAALAIAVRLRLAAQEQPTTQRALLTQAGQAQQVRYKVVDIGTLGGPTSYASSSAPGYQILNNEGMLTGAADTSIPDPNAPNCANADCFVSHAIRWKDGVLTDLGALPGVNSSSAVAINAHGWITGGSENGAIDPVTGLPEVRAVLWGKNGQIFGLGTLGGMWNVPANANSVGQVVGFATNAIPDPFTLFIGGTQTRAYLWQNGVIQDLGTLGGPDAMALYVNERGQVSGISYTNATPNATTGIPTLHPFLWDHGNMIDLGTLGGTFSGQEPPFRVNNRGQVIGTSTLAGDLISHPFLWDHGVLTDLGTLGGDNGATVWINDDGEVVGDADLPGSAVHHAYLWRDGVMTDLGTLGSTSHAEAINSKEQVVGRSRIGAVDSPFQHAFLSENGEPMIDLNTLIPANSNVELVEAQNINDRGEIAALGAPPGVAPFPENPVGIHLFLLIPCGADDGQGCEDSAQFAPAAPQHNVVPITKPSTPSTQGRPTPRGLAAAWRARLAQRYHIPGALARPAD
jgi:probable HAF family extracellular repeat protein